MIGKTTTEESNVSSEKISKNLCVLSVGSNTVDRDCKVLAAIEWLKGMTTDLLSSTIYETESVSGDGKKYINCVASAKVDISLDDFNSLLKKYEIENGRDSKSRECGYVPIDIDIVIFNGENVRPKEFQYEYFMKGYRMLGLS